MPKQAQPDQTLAHLSAAMFLGVCGLGMPTSSKTDEFSEKFQTAFDPPPPHFRKVILQIF